MSGHGSHASSAQALGPLLLSLGLLQVCANRRLRRNRRSQRAAWDDVAVTSGRPPIITVPALRTAAVRIHGTGASERMYLSFSPPAVSCRPGRGALPLSRIRPNFLGPGGASVILRRLNRPVGIFPTVLPASRYEGTRIGVVNPTVNGTHDPVNWLTERPCARASRSWAIPSDSGPGSTCSVACLSHKCPDSRSLGCLQTAAGPSRWACPRSR